MVVHHWEWNDPEKRHKNGNKLKKKKIIKLKDL